MQKIILMALVLFCWSSNVSADSSQMPSKKQAIACFQQFVTYATQNDLDMRKLFVQTIDRKSAALLMVKRYQISYGVARARINKRLQGGHSTAFRNMDLDTVTFTRQSRAVKSPTYTNKSPDWMYELVGYYRTTDKPEKGESLSPRHTFVFWLKIAKPTCPIVDVMWNNAGLGRR